MRSSTTSGASGNSDPLVHGMLTDGVYRLTLDSPHNRNALSERLLVEAHQRLDDALEHPPRAVIIDHTGPAFCAGADLSERSDGPVDSGPFVRLLERLMDMPCPSIAAVRGPARAGGIGLLAACDLVVVDPNVTFALTEVRIGVTAAIISVPILRRVSPSAIAAALLTGQPFDAPEARRIGLVTHVSDDVDATLAELVAGIRAGSPAAVAATKTLLHTVPALDRHTAFDRMRRLSEEFFASADAREGMAAFREKRPPAWADGRPT